MSVLWIAFGIYIVGIAVVLYLRPSIMFQPGGGTWKEFGLANTGNYTVFPFWMFTLLWAIVSYALATLVSLFVASIALQPSAASEPDVGLIPASQMAPKRARVPRPPKVAAPALEVAPPEVPGYYVLESPSGQLPRYVYYGTEPPQI